MNLFELNRALKQLRLGGMAAVFRAVDRRTRQTVALKRLHPRFLDDPQTVSLFRDEARLGLQIAHPEVCRTLEQIDVAGEPIIVMECLEGVALSAVLTKLVASNERVSLVDPFVSAQIVALLARGLSAIHTATDVEGRPLHAVHRDVTPQNVLILETGGIKLLDLGVAYCNRRSAHTEKGLVKGKLAYLAPEYLTGGAWDRQVDLWSLGVVLWELLTQRRLFKADSTAATLRGVLKSEIVSPKHYAPHVPSSLADVTLKLLERDVKRRYQTAQQVALAIASCLDRVGERISARRLAEWQRRVFDVSSPDALDSDLMPCAEPVSVPSAVARPRDEETTLCLQPRRVSEPTELYCDSGGERTAPFLLSRKLGT